MNFRLVLVAGNQPLVPSVPAEYLPNAGLPLGKSRVTLPGFETYTSVLGNTPVQPAHISTFEDCVQRSMAILLSRYYQQTLVAFGLLDSPVANDQEPHQTTGPVSYTLALWQVDPDLPVGSLGLSDQVYPEAERAHTDLLTLAGAKLLASCHWGGDGVAKLSLTSARSAYRATAIEEDCAQRYPDHLALAHGTEEWTYAQLDYATSELARGLIEKYGSQREMRIALLIPKSIAFIVALLAVFKSGAAYVPIDPDYPTDRIQFILDDSAAALAITVESALDRLSGQSRVPVLVVDPYVHLSAKNAEVSGFEPVSSSPHDLAYVVYTSGTTGQPKGVQVEHRSLTNIVTDPNLQDAHGPGNRVIQMMSVAFDGILYEIFHRLCAGSTVMIPTTDILADLSEATAGCFVPSFLARLDPTNLAKLKAIVTGGESLTPELQAQWAHRCTLANMYGPTETTIFSNMAIIRPDDDITIGQPIRNVFNLVVDDELRLVPVGVPGELLIGGIGLARGYQNLPNATRTKFIPNPYGPGRVYRTGDYARWLPNGTVEFLGRIDNQIKLRGYRIELEEVENTASRFPGLKHSVAAVVHDKLVLYSSPDDLDHTALLEFLVDNLPKQMVPELLVSVTEFQTSTSGKLDRKSLPSIDHLVRQSSNSATVIPNATDPLLDVNQDLRLAWAQVLQLDPERINPTDHFFRIGGDSISAILLVSRVQKLGYQLTVPLIYQYPELHQMTQNIPQATTVTKKTNAIYSGPIQGTVDLTPVQRWFFSIPFHNQHHFNQSFTLKVNPHCPLPLSAVTSALVSLMNHHDILRARFQPGEDEQGWTQAITMATSSPVDIFLTEDSVAPVDYPDFILNVQSRLNLTTGPVLAAALIYHPTTPSDTRLFITIHHALVDLISWRILIEDLNTLLRGDPLPPKTLPFQAWAAQLGDYAGRLSADVWPTQVNPGNPIQDIITLLPPPEVDDGDTSSARISTSLEFNQEFTDALLFQLAPQWRVTPRDLLLATFTQTFAHTVGLQQVSLCMEGHGREPWSAQQDITRTVGWFTALYPLVLHTRPGQSLLEFLRHTKEALQQIPGKGFPYALLKYMPGVPAEERAKLQAKTPARLDVQFNYFGRFNNDANNSSSDDPLSIEWSDYFGLHDFAPDDHVIFDINPMPTIVGDCLRLVIEYNPRVYSRIVIDQVMAGWRHNLAELADVTKRAQPLYAEPLLTQFDFAHLQLSSSEFQDIVGELNRRHIPLSQLEELLPCIALQSGLLTGVSTNPSSYLLQAALKIMGPLDLDRLVRAWDSVAEQHAPLRTIFFESSAKQSRGFIQVVLQPSPNVWTIQDRPLFSLDEFFRSNRQRGFTLKDIMIRNFVFPTADDQVHHVVITIHHSLIDGWSLPLLLQAWMDAYHQSSMVSLVPGASFTDMVDHVQRFETTVAQTFWTEYLLNAPITPAPLLQPDYCGQSGFTTQATILKLPKGRLIQAAQKYGISLSVLLRAAYAVVLSRLLDQDDVVFGITVAGRNLEIPGIEQVIGPCANTVPFRVRLDRSPLESWLKSIHQAQIAMISFEHTQLTDITKWVASGRRRPLFHTLVGSEHFPDPVTNPLHTLVMSNMGIDELTEYQLAINFIERTTCVEAKVSYSRSTYSDVSIDQLVDMVQIVLGQIMAALPDCTVDQLSLDSPISTLPHELVTANGNEPLHTPTVSSLFQQWNDAVTKDPIGVVYQGDAHSLTYLELNQVANSLAFRTAEAVEDRLVSVVALVESIECLLGCLVAAITLGVKLSILPTSYSVDDMVAYIDSGAFQVVWLPSSLVESIRPYVAAESVLVSVVGSSGYHIENVIELSQHPSMTDPMDFGLSLISASESECCTLPTAHCHLVHHALHSMQSYFDGVDTCVVNPSLTPASPQFPWLALSCLLSGTPIVSSSLVAPGEETASVCQIVTVDDINADPCDGSRLVLCDLAQPTWADILHWLRPSDTCLVFIASIIHGHQVVTAEHLISRSLPSSGKPFSDTILAVLDGCGHSCPPGVVGRLALVNLHSADKVAPIGPPVLGYRSSNEMVHILGASHQRVIIDDRQLHLGVLEQVLVQAGARSPKTLLLPGGQAVHSTVGATLAQLEQLQFRIRQKYDVQLTIGDLVKHSDFCDLANIITNLVGRIKVTAVGVVSNHNSYPTVNKPAPYLRLLAPTERQQRIWSLSQLDEPQVDFHHHILISSSAPLRLEDIQRSINYIAAQYEELRCRFVSEQGVLTCRTVLNMQIGVSEHLIDGPHILDDAYLEETVPYFDVTQVLCEPWPTAPLISDSETRLLLKDFAIGSLGLTNPPETPHVNILELFFKTAKKNPEQVATEIGVHTQTYAALAQSVQLMANRLRLANVQPGDRVGVVATSHPDTIMCMLAIWCARAVYVPVDNKLPHNRQKYIVDIAECTRVVTVTGVSTVWSEALNSENLSPGPDGHPHESMEYTVQPNDTAYIVFTSGTTGLPKGIVVQHRSLNNVITNEAFASLRHPGMRFLCQVSPGFDASILVLLFPLVYGMTLVFPNETGPDILSTITSAMLPLSVIAPLEPSQFPNLKALVVGAEPLPLELAAKWTPFLELYNGYGPSETTIISHVGRVISGSRISIGRPIANTECYILDGNLQLVPIGTVGEIFIGGVCVSQGYINRPDLNASKFIDNPFTGQGKLYNSGDLGRWLPDGQVECLGRADGQIKLRGFRIELDEIRSVLLRQPGVKDCAVFVNDSFLVSYVIPETAVNEDRLRTALAKLLPSYMIPSYIVGLPTMPLTVNSKCDTKFLQNHFVEHLASQRTLISLSDAGPSPSSQPAKVLTQALIEVLGLSPNQVNLLLSFVKLGGDSISGIQVSSKCRQLGYALPGHALLGRESLQDAVQDMIAITSTAGIAGQLHAIDYQTSFPLTPIQTWFLDHPWANPHHFNQSFALELVRPISVAQLSSALLRLVNHHDMLRCQFIRDSTSSSHQWSQRVLPPFARLPVPVFELNASPSDLTDHFIDIQSSLDISQGHLLATGLITLSNNDTPQTITSQSANVQHLLFITVHHLVVDLVSWAIILEDLSLLLEDKPPVPQHLPFATWATELAEWAQETITTTNQDASPPTQPLETMFPHIRPDTMSLNYQDNIQARSIKLDIAMSNAVLHVDTHGIQPLEVMMAGLFRALFSISQAPTVTIFNESHGRLPFQPTLDPSRTVGWFTALVPCQAQVNSDTTVADYLKVAKQARRSSSGTQGLKYGLHHMLDKSRDTEIASSSYAPIEVAFNYLGNTTDQSTLTRGGRALWTVRPDLTSHLAVCDPAELRPQLLEVIGVPTSSGLKFTIHYCPQVVPSGVIESLLAEFQQALADMVHLLEQPDCLPFWTLSDFPLLSSTLPKGTAPEFDINKFIEEELPLLDLGADDIEDIYPCLPLQEGMLFATIQDPTAYAVQLTFTITGDLDITRFQKAWDDTAQIHNTLRTRFIMGTGGQADRNIQLITKSFSPQWVIGDWRDSVISTLDVKFTQAERAAGFPSHLPLIKFGLFRITENTYRFFVSAHHAILDGWSNGPLFRTALEYYSGLTPTSHSLLFKDFVGHILAKDQSEAESFWARQFASVETPSLLTEPHHRPDNRTHPNDDGFYGIVEHTVGPLDALNRFTKDLGITLSTVLRAALAAVLQRYTGSDFPVFGAVVSGRNVDLDGIANMVGLCINTVPCCVPLAGNVSVADVLQSIQTNSTVMCNYEHNHLSDIHRWSGISTEKPLFNTIFVLENYPETSDDPNLPIHFHLERGWDPTDYSLSIGAFTKNDQLKFRLTYRQLDFSDTFMSGFANHFAQAINSIVSLGPQASFRDVELFAEAERHQLLHSFAANPRPFVLDYIHSIFQYQARLTPNHTALIEGNERYTYAQLDTASDHFAQVLAQSVDCGPDRIIGILAERSLELVISQLAVWKTGSAFVCLVPNFPLDRMWFILADAQCPAVIGRAEFLAALSDIDISRIPIDALPLLTRGESAPFVSPAISPSNLAYVVYTSGSTGAPKGVMIEHQSLSNFMLGFNIDFPAGPDTVVPAMLTPTFDMSILEIWSPLSFGGTSLVFPGDYESALQLATRVIAVPSLMACFEPSHYPNLQQLILCGEPMPVKVAQNWGPVVELINAYGPSETTILSHWNRMRVDESTIHVGTPMANVTSIILDSYMRPVPIGSTGQIYLGGLGLARGYLQQPELTGEKFMECPFTGGRLYRSGDLGRWLPGGRVECLGRADFQVKLRGYRMELGEVESALERHPAVDQARVLIQDDTHLVGYVVPVAGRTAGILDFLRGRLPHYMVPSGLVELAQLPLTQVGKVDRRSLPRFDFTITRCNENPVELSPTETELVALIAEILEIEPSAVVLEATFFQLGGNSLTAIQLVTRCHRLTIGLDLADINRQNTIAYLAKLASVPTEDSAAESPSDIESDGYNSSIESA
ncbi:hypothetical protein BJ085DRAFT_37012 [Dimargaris cristalligena]|uniref:Carrier domain-containing protein n=1 Tax=Dimargaris cristalligena TaxID=215637 RepID=A0A4V1J5U6_9FUNG|nr:hypothetical protein BJ085DRAFT_37012 [Dimargaris cristalligena]|eukprot:RKP40289.1 hypothetical protein BJ085DRAFT_37012 [Dimargaris cristalligena]